MKILPRRGWSLSLRLGCLTIFAMALARFGHAAQPSPSAPNPEKAGQPNAAGSAEERFVIEAVDMTKKGKKLTPPSPEHPVYYIPVFDGYKEKGGVSKFYVRKPEDKDTALQLVNMLKKQGYVLASRKNPPKLVLVFEWGSIVPAGVGETEGGRRPNPAFISNASEIRAYVMGERARNMSPYHPYYTEMRSLEARHYIMISAFEYHEEPQPEEVLLWRAHVTTDLWGNYLDEVLPQLIAHAAPIVGRDVPPGGAWSPKDGKVIIGAPVVVPEARGEEKPGK